MALNQDDLVKSFTIWDYLVFASMLLISSLIGLYYACTGGKQKTTREFLMADRNMRVLPISISLLASSISAVSLLGIPAEVYTFNTSYWLILIGYIITTAIISHFYLPVFYKLRITSVYEYLERRFNRTIRKFGSLLYIIQTTIYIAIVMYAPALALSQVTGFHVWASLSTIGVVCIFYTTLGGLKAVIWTDVFQAVLMFGSMIAVIIWGCVDIGGIDRVWQRASDGKRLDIFNMSLDPSVRHSFASLTIGGTFTMLCIFGVGQAQVQRYLSTPTMKTAKMALWWNMVGTIFLITTCCLTGLVIYAIYWDCDPLQTNQVVRSDQLVPLFVMDKMGVYPGLPGFFVAGIFSGSLSTIAAGFNSLAAVTLEDIVKSCFPGISETKATIVSKILPLFYGILCIILVAIVERLGNILQAAMSVFGIIGGPVLGVFSLGIFFPSANSIGAGVGLFSGLAITFWIVTGALTNNLAKFIPKSPVSTIGCIFNNSLDIGNITTESVLNNSTNTPIIQPEILGIYKLSYLWYSLMGCSIVVFVGLIVSYISGINNPDDVDPELIYPIYQKCCCYLPKKLRNILKCGTKKSLSSQTDVELNVLKQKMLS